MTAPADSQFPKGLRVLLVDEHPSRSVVEAQLRQPELQYAVTAVSTAAEALGFLRAGVAAFDVVLAESRVVATEESVGRSFVHAFEDTPVVLMSECGSTQDVLRAVHLGAADFLDKPLSLLKLKNIWQHSVRKMMLKAAGPRRSPVPMAGMAPAPVATLPMVLPFHQGGALPLPPWTAMAATKPAPASTASPSLTSSPSLSLLELESMGPESPATPSALSDDFHDTFSCMSGADSGSPSLRTSLDEPSDSFVEALNSALCTSPPLPRPTSVTSLPTVVPAAAAPAPAAPAQWPALTPGCVWGTPANGPVPPPLPCSVAAAATPSWAGLSPAPPAPVLIKPGGAAPAPAAPVLPLAAAAEVAPSMDFLLSDLLAPKPGAAPGPLGLKLRKSSSLLNLINSTLSTDAPTACGPTPMVCC